MTAKWMMILGAIWGGMFGFVSIIGGEVNTVILFACGALFGKGYGVWEERSRQRGSET